MAVWATAPPQARKSRQARELILHSGKRREYP
jgi:hypothetical protein